MGVRSLVLVDPNKVIKGRCCCRLNERVLNTEKSRYFELVKSGSKLNEAVMYASIDGVHPLTIWVVADMSQPTHRDLLVNALDHSVSILLDVSYETEKYLHLLSTYGNCLSSCISLGPTFFLMSRQK